MLLSNSNDIKLCFVLLCMLPLALKEEPSQNQKIKDVTSDAIFHTYCKIYAYNVIVELSLVGYNL